MSGEKNARSNRAGEVEVIFTYPDISDMKCLQITNSRRVALHLIESGYTTCLVPQMFFSDTGLYGLHSLGDSEKRTKEEAEQFLSDQEENIRKNFWGSRNQAEPLVQNQGANQTP